MLELKSPASEAFFTHTNQPASAKWDPSAWPTGFCKGLNAYRDSLKCIGVILYLGVIFRGYFGI